MKPSISIMHKKISELMFTIIIVEPECTFISLDDYDNYSWCDTDSLSNSASTISINVANVVQFAPHTGVLSHSSVDGWFKIYIVVAILLLMLMMSLVANCYYWCWRRLLLQNITFYADDVSRCHCNSKFVLNNANKLTDKHCRVDYHLTIITKGVILSLSMDISSVWWKLRCHL